MAWTSFSGLVLAGSYFAHAQPFSQSAFASSQPSTFSSAALTAAAQPVHVMPLISSSTSLGCSAPNARLTEKAASVTKNKKTLFFIMVL